MMKRMVDALSQLNERLLLGLLLFLLSLLAFEGWLLVLRQPYAHYEKVKTTRTALSASLGQSEESSSEMGRLADELKQLTEQLGGALRLQTSDDQMAASLMEMLDLSASAHGLLLSSIKPKEKKPVSVFEEISYEVSAKGRYLQLAAWMLDFGKTLGHNATVTDFDMRAADAGQLVTLSMTIALYRPMQRQGGQL
jgi:Tfp pilus assembly protein PilO